MVHRQPQAPTVMVEQQRKGYGDRKQGREDNAIGQIRKNQTSKISNQNEDFRRDDVRHDRADEKSFFAFEDYAAGSALMFEIERPLHDRGFTANRALQLHRTPKRAGN